MGPIWAYVSPLQIAAPPALVCANMRTSLARMNSYVESLAAQLVLGDVLLELRRRHGEWDLVAHWEQGELHHDLVLRLPEDDDREHPAILVIATNATGGVKEVYAFDEAPERDALWHYRCPEMVPYAKSLPGLRACARTGHWSDPRTILGAAPFAWLTPIGAERTQSTADA